ncbi:recombinase family protein [Streptomyces sp. C184]|uniref:recombinase family protein n=1 Tax=Streptomyces sp. C184 TaxID=3237121 RepID=UPI0034C64D92
MGDGRRDIEGRQHGPITLLLVNRCLEEHDKDITRFCRPRAPSFSPPLAALPASPAGARIGYARVSPKGQLLDRQIAALEAAGCARIFADKKSGKSAEHEELWAALDYLRPGDTLVVPVLDRLGTDHPVLPGLEERTAPPACVYGLRASPAHPSLAPRCTRPSRKGGSVVRAEESTEYPLNCGDAGLRGPVRSARPVPATRPGRCRVGHTWSALVSSAAA